MGDVYGRRRQNMRFLKGFIFGLFLSCVFYSYADKISSPPPLSDINPALIHYLQELYVNFHRLEVVTTNPDSARSGKRGDMLLLQTGGSNYLEINTDSSTQWRGILLQDSP